MSSATVPTPNMSAVPHCWHHRVRSWPRVVCLDCGKDLTNHPLINSKPGRINPVNAIYIHAAREKARIRERVRIHVLIYHYGFHRVFDAQPSLLTEHRFVLCMLKALAWHVRPANEKSAALATAMNRDVMHIVGDFVEINTRAKLFVICKRWCAEASSQQNKGKWEQDADVRQRNWPTRLMRASNDTLWLEILKEQRDTDLARSAHAYWYNQDDYIKKMFYGHLSFYSKAVYSKAVYGQQKKIKVKKPHPWSWESKWARLCQQAYLRPSP